MLIEAQVYLCQGCKVFVKPTTYPPIRYNQIRFSVFTDSNEEVSHVHICDLSDLNDKKNEKKKLLILVKA